jgi:hypothetical protein
VIEAGSYEYPRTRGERGSTKMCRHEQGQLISGSDDVNNILHLHATK